MSAAAAEMVAVEPEAFGLDQLDVDRTAPRLGCATTGQLITELAARLAVEDEGQPATDTCGWYLTRVRERLTGEQLAYRTIDS